MSSPDRPISNLEDAFSSNFPNYLPPVSPDYIPTSPGKTYSSSSNSFGIVPLVPPTLSLFHDDPYMKVLQAFYNDKSPIPPPVIIHPSSKPKPQKFFLLEEFLSPKKQGRSSSSTSSLPQVFVIDGSSRKPTIEQHEEHQPKNKPSSIFLPQLRYLILLSTGSKPLNWYQPYFLFSALDS
ncbi:hypothetical protein Tco_0401231 [Tanacetum coccineum]